MSDLDTKLANLRDDLTATITPPELAHVAGQARQRTLRRRLQIGAVAAVVAASVAVPVLRSLPDTDQPPAAPPVTGLMTFQLDFADADHGYALGSDCVGPERRCLLALFATDDGGRHWVRRELPRGGERYVLGDMVVIDADRLAVDRAPAVGRQQMTRVVSEDQGRTWRDGALLKEASPAVLPDGARIQDVCVRDDDGGGCRLGFGAAAPAGDAVAPAPAQPTLTQPQKGRSPTRDGRYWAAGIDWRSGRWAISVSADRGRTWATTPVSLPGEPATNGAWSVVENDGVLYATVRGSIAHGPYGLLAVFRSTDDGETWTNTWRATPDTVLRGMVGSPVVTADGRLLVHSATTGTHESRDGTTFTRAARQLPGEVTWTRAGYVAKRGNHSYAVSADGIEWRNIEIGADG